MSAGDLDRVYNYMYYFLLFYYYYYCNGVGVLCAASRVICFAVYTRRAATGSSSAHYKVYRLV